MKATSSAEGWDSYAGAPSAYVNLFHLLPAPNLDGAHLFLKACGRRVVQGASLTAARFPDHETLAYEAASLFSLVPSSDSPSSPGASVSNQQPREGGNAVMLAKKEEDDEVALEAVERMAQRAHDQFVRLVWTKQAYGSFWSPHPQASGSSQSSSRATKQAASFFRRDPWPLLHSHFVAHTAASVAAAPNHHRSSGGPILRMDLDGLWKLLVEEYWWRWFASVSSEDGTASQPPSPRPSLPASPSAAQSVGLPLRLSAGGGGGGGGGGCGHPPSCVCFNLSSLSASSPSPRGWHLGGMNRTRHSFTCFFLFGTVWARELAPFLSPSHLDEGAVQESDHFLFIDVDNCAKVLDFVESSVPPHVKIYGFCGAGYSQVSASPAFHRLTEKGIMHLIPCPVGQPPSVGTKPTAAEESAGGRAMADFFNAFYDQGCDRKYKNAADYLLSMFAGVMHVLFPMRVPFWILSHDDGLDNTAEALWCRGREANRVPTKHIIDHSLWTLVRHNALLRSAPLQPPTTRRPAPSASNAATAAYADGYGEGFLDWGLNDEAVFGRGGSLSDFMDEAWTNHYDITAIRRVPCGQYDALYPPADVDAAVASTTAATTTTAPSREADVASTRKRRQREDEVKDRAQLKERNGHSPPKEKKSKEEERKGRKNEHEETETETETANTGAPAVVQDITFGERVSVQWNGSRYEKSVLKRDLIQPRDDGAPEVPPIRLPASGDVNLTLRGHRFSSKGIALLGEVLNVPSVAVKSLDLRGNRIGDGGLDRLVDLLCGVLGRRLGSLDIRGNEIDDRGTAELARFLAKSHTLHYFDLRWNKVGAAGARALAQALARNTTLGILNLRENRLGMDGVMTLADFLLSNRSVYSLDLRANISPPTEMNYRIGESGDEAIKYLGALLKLNSSLTHLDLCSNNIGSEGAMALASALEFRSSLYILHLDFNRIDFAGVRALGRSLLTNQSLLVLTLAHNFLEDDAVCSLAKALASNVYLTKLDLQKNHIANKGASALAEALKTNHTLTELYLSYNAVGDAGAYRLADALKHNEGLLSLELENNKITSRGGSAFASMLARNSTLRFFNLSGNLITDDGLTAISRALMSNPASALLDLQVSGIDGRDECWDVLREMMRHNRRLLRLDISSNPIHHPLCGRRPVRFEVRDASHYYPHYASASTDDERASKPRENNRMRGPLRWSTGGGGAVPLLSISPPPSSSSFSSSPLSSSLTAGAMSPPAAMPATTNRYKGDGGNRHKGDHNRDKRPDDVRHHHPHSRLRNTFLLDWLQLEAQDEDTGTTIAEQSSHIELVCEDGEDGEERKGPYNICRILEENSSLVWLVMANVNLNMMESTDALRQRKPRGKRGRRLARRAERTLREQQEEEDAVKQKADEEEEETFVMDEDVIGDDEKTETMNGDDEADETGMRRSHRFMRSLSKALARNGNLTSLDLSWNRLDAATIAPLAEALDNRRQDNAALSLLTTLVLRGNHLGDEGVAVLSGSLLHNCTITNLNLDGNRITDQGVKALAGLVEGNEVLAYLSLVSNVVRNEGLVALGQALACNRSIIKLSLERNPLEREAVAAFWKLLASIDLQRGPATDVEFVSIGI